MVSPNGSRVAALDNNGDFWIGDYSLTGQVYTNTANINTMKNDIDLIHPSSAYYATGDGSFDAYAYERPCKYPYLFGHSESVEMNDPQGGGYWKFAHTINWGTAYSAQLVFGVHGNMFFRSSDDASGWSTYRKVIASSNVNAKYDFNNLSCVDGSEYSQMVLPLYYYDSANFAGFGVNSGGIPILKVGTSETNRHLYYFSTDGNIYVDNLYKVLTNSHVYVSESTLYLNL